MEGLCLPSSGIALHFSRQRCTTLMLHNKLPFTLKVSASSAVMHAAPNRVPVMVNDCTGKMGRAVAEAAVAAGLELVPLSLTGPGLGRKHVVIGDFEVDVYDSSEKDIVVDTVLQRYPDVIVVDYTLPTAVNGNAEFYCKRGLPFVMGTTGGDRTNLMDTVEKFGNYAVIAPQMGKQVVAFVAAMEIMAEQFPGAFAGYKLQVAESHQSSKVDVSGTALSVVSSLRKLGLHLEDNQIEMIRDPERQVKDMGVPSEYLNGHAFHTYNIVSSDGTVSFQFQHNVCGRSIYAQGSIDAVLFLARKISEKSEKRIFNMIDVLRGGSMR